MFRWRIGSFCYLENCAWIICKCCALEQKRTVSYSPCGKWWRRYSSFHYRAAVDDWHTLRSWLHPRTRLLCLADENQSHRDVSIGRKWNFAIRKNGKSKHVCSNASHKRLTCLGSWNKNSFKLFTERIDCSEDNSRVELQLCGLIGTTSRPDMQKLRIIGFFFENGVHWQF